MWQEERGVDLEPVIFRSGRLPDCVEHEGTRCQVCLFEDWRTCPVLADPDYRSYLRWVWERQVEYYRQREKRIETLRRILATHKLPLHWEMVANISMNEAGNLFGSPQEVKGLLFINEDAFRHRGEGIFGLPEWRH